MVPFRWTYFSSVRKIFPEDLTSKSGKFSGGHGIWRETLSVPALPKELHSKRNLMSHRMTHLGIRLLECDVCHQRFNQRASLYRHRKLHNRDTLTKLDLLDNSSDFSDSQVNSEEGSLMSFSPQLIHNDWNPEATSPKEHYVVDLHPSQVQLNLDSVAGDLQDSEAGANYIGEDEVRIDSNKSRECENSSISNNFSNIRGTGNDHSHAIGNSPLETKEFNSPSPSHTGQVNSSGNSIPMRSSNTDPAKARFQCPVCLRRFTRKENMQMHMLCHSGVKPVQCGICFRRFTQRASLNRHIKTVHSVDRMAQQMNIEQNMTNRTSPFQNSPSNSPMVVNYNHGGMITQSVRYMQTSPRFSALPQTSGVDYRKVMGSGAIMSPPPNLEMVGSHTMLGQSMSPSLYGHINQSLPEYQQNACRFASSDRRKPIEGTNMSGLPKIDEVFSQSPGIFISPPLPPASHVSNPSEMNLHSSSNPQGITSSITSIKNGEQESQMYPLETLSPTSASTSSTSIAIKVEPEENQIFSCNLCPKKFTRKENLEVHELWHSGIKCVKCDVCQQAFSRPSELFRHKKIHHEKTSIASASVADSQTNGSSALMASNEKRFWCDVCHKGFTRKESLRLHHLSHLGVKPAQCDICDKSFTQPATLYRHRKLHFKDGDQVIMIRQRGGRTNLSQLKSNLGKTSQNAHVSYLTSTPNQKNSVSSRAAYQNQVQNAVNDETGHFPCDQCPKIFTRKVSLQLHQLRHIGIKPTQCDYCFKKMHPSSLFRHKMLHTSERRFICGICGKKFFLQCDLSFHQKRHAGAEFSVKLPPPSKAIQTPLQIQVSNSANHEMNLDSNENMMDDSRDKISDLREMPSSLQICSPLETIPVQAELVEMNEDYPSLADSSLEDNLGSLRSSQELFCNGLIPESEIEHPRINNSLGNMENEMAKEVNEKDDMHGKKLKRCPVCSKLFLLTETLQSHLESHPEDQIIMASHNKINDDKQCGSKSSEANLKNRKYSCSFCKKEFTYFSSWLWHKQMHKKQTRISMENAATELRQLQCFTNGWLSKSTSHISNTSKKNNSVSRQTATSPGQFVSAKIKYEPVSHEEQVRVVSYMQNSHLRHKDSSKERKKIKRKVKRKRVLRNHEDQNTFRNETCTPRNNSSCRTNGHFCQNNVHSCRSDQSCCRSRSSNSCHCNGPVPQIVYILSSCINSGNRCCANTTQQNLSPCCQVNHSCDNPQTCNWRSQSCCHVPLGCYPALLNYLRSHQPCPCDAHLRSCSQQDSGNCRNSSHCQNLSCSHQRYNQNGGGEISQTACATAFENQTPSGNNCSCRGPHSSNCIDYISGANQSVTNYQESSEKAVEAEADLPDPQQPSSSVSHQPIEAALTTENQVSIPESTNTTHSQVFNELLPNMKDSFLMFFSNFCKENNISSSLPTEDSINRFLNELFPTSDRKTSGSTTDEEMHLDNNDNDKSNNEN